MGINIGGIVGGIAGALIPGAGFLAPAIGAGLGTLAGGGSSKNAIKYALLAGGANTAFGIGETLRGTPMGGALSDQMVKAGIGKPLVAKGTIGADTATKGIFSNPFVQAFGLSALAGKPEQPSTLTGSSEGYDGSTIDRSKFLENLYASRFDGKRFDTAAERDEYDRNLEESQNIVQGMSSGGLYARGGLIEGLGGLIEGPGTGTSDDIPAMIYQDGNPVQEAMLSNGEVVLSLKDLRNIGGGDAEMAGQMIGDAPNGTRGAVAAKLFRNMQEFKNG